MTGLHLTPEAVQARRLELAEVDAQIKALGRRKSQLRAEILSGYAAPVKGVAAEQLTLGETTPATTATEAPAQAPEAAKPATATTTARTALQMREAVLAALRAAKGRRSGQVLATLLGESEEDVHECLMELIQRGEARSARRGGYEATDKPQPQGRDTKPGKASKKPLWKPGYKPGILPSLTPEGNRRALELIRAAPGKKMLTSEVRKALDLPDDCCTPSGCYYQGSQAGGDWWGIRDDGAPTKSAKPAAKKAPSKGKKAPEAPKPTRTIGETKPKILDGISIEQWQEGIHSVAGLINASGAARGAWLLLHARPSATVAAEVVDLFERAGAIVPGETIQLAAAIEASRQERPGARLSLLITERVSKWVIDLVASSPKPPSADALAKRTGLHRGLFCALLNALEDEGCLRRSKGGGVPVWVVPAVTRTAPLFDDVEPAPAVDGLEPEGDEP